MSDFCAYHTCRLMLSYRCIVCHTLCIHCDGHIMHGPVRKQLFIAKLLAPHGGVVAGSCACRGIGLTQRQHLGLKDNSKCT